MLSSFVYVVVWFASPKSIDQTRRNPKSGHLNWQLSLGFLCNDWRRIKCVIILIGHPKSNSMCAHKTLFVYIAYFSLENIYLTRLVILFLKSTEMKWSKVSNQMKIKYKWVTIVFCFFVVWYEIFLSFCIERWSFFCLLVDEGDCFLTFPKIDGGNFALKCFWCDLLSEK